MNVSTGNNGKHTQAGQGSIECPRCHGTGWVLYERDMKEIYGGNDPVWVEYAAPCPECRGGADIKAATVRKRANIPAVCYDATLNQFDWTYLVDGKQKDTSKHKQLAEAFINRFDEWEQKGMGLYIYSRTRGSGKSYLASCLCNELMKGRALITKFVRVGDLLDIAKSADKSSPDEYERNPILLLQRCKLLVLDDIGQKQSGGAWLDDILFQIIDARVSQNLVTIYTSNIPIEELEVDERIVSRIHQKSVMLRLPEYSHRGKVAELVKDQFLHEIGVM